jgi:hypothetical protein
MLLRALLLQLLNVPGSLVISAKPYLATVPSVGIYPKDRV